MGYAEAQYTAEEIIAGIKKTSYAGVEPDNMVDIGLTVNSANKILITFEVGDTIINGQTICKIKGVIIRRKIGAAPTDENDGDLVGIFEDGAVHDHIIAPIVDIDLVAKTYYRFFPYSDTGILNRNQANIAYIDTNANSSHEMIVGFHQDFTNLDPDTSITYLKSATNFTPMHTNAGTGKVTEGSWGVWPWLQQNLPYMVKSTGEVDYQLDPNDYTLKLDGTASAVKTASYAGGAYAWIPKIYMKEVYAADGNSRDVYFAMNNTSEETRDFHLAPGFRDREGNELEGLWIPMFYGNSNSKSLATTSVNVSYNINTVITEVTKYSARAALFGGPVRNTLRDIFYMLYRSANIQEKGWYGNCTANGNFTTNPIVGGGRFNGTNTKTTLDKALHSLIFSYERKLLEPYLTTRYNSGKYALFVAKNYTQTFTGYAGKFDYDGSISKCATKLEYVDDEIGSMPSRAYNDYIATSETGLCDKVNTLSGASGSYYTGWIFGSGAGRGLEAGPGSYEFSMQNTQTTFSSARAVMLLPPVGHKPA